MADNAIFLPFGYHLPAELNDAIFEYVTGAQTISGPDRSISGLRLINRSWNAYLTPFFYSTYTFHGNPNRLPALWEFVNMVVTRPERAAMVKRLVMTTMELYEPFNFQNLREILLFTWRCGDSYFRRARTLIQESLPEPRTDDEIIDWLAHGYLAADGTVQPRRRDMVEKSYFRALYKESRPWLKPAMAAVGFSHGVSLGFDLRTGAERALNRGDTLLAYQCPLVALIVAHCPNLTHLTMHLWPSGVDPWFDWTLGFAVGRQAGLLELGEKPLQRLQRLEVTTWMIRGANQVVTAGAPFEISEEHRPFYRLPRLKELTTFRARITQSVADLDDLSNIPKTIERLTLHGLALHLMHPKRMLELTPHLRQLTLHIPGNPGNVIVDPLENNGPSLYQRLWDWLLPFKHQLEYLDLYQEEVHRMVFLDWHNASPGTNFCVPLREFTRLRQLNIPLLMLAGNSCALHDHPVKFRNHLPPNIETLGLYTNDLASLDRWVDPTRVRKELKGIVQEGTHRRNWLKTIILDDYHQGNLPARTMRRIAYRRGIAWFTSSDRFLFRGGQDTPLAITAQGGGMSREDLHAAIESLLQQWVMPQGLTVHGIEGEMPFMPVNEVDFISDSDDNSEETEEDNNEQGEDNIDDIGDETDSGDSEDEPEEGDELVNWNGNGNVDGDEMDIDG
ncbi:hypothetical protein BDW59DRAFT_152226 [Aspergillus cavernicola]|uniref:F-box domain-containing protein n=1 Tax=Aspergillus cavernicola TaxID=176166 RepID=A0ABR4HRS7_9EURO